jgi:hypothetical protein
MVTLDDLYTELKHGHVYECSIRDPDGHLYGLQSGRDVFIDPRTSILIVLLHELLHRRFKRWGEKRVDAEALRLLLAMDEKTKRRWWRAYGRVKRKSVPVDMVAD